jgi:ribosomal protein S18 acetylase RimI-like enzyme
MQSVEIQIATANDTDLLASLGRRAFYEAFGQYNDPADMQAYLDLAFNPENIRSQINDSGNTFLIASLHQEPVGYAKLKRNSTVPELKSASVIHLERIYALQEFIGKKVGKSLMEACLEISRKEGYEKMWLSVWQENKTAIAFYEKWGFKVIGYKQFIIGQEVNEDFVMCMDINTPAH